MNQRYFTIANDMCSLFLGYGSAVSNPYDPVGPYLRPRLADGPGFGAPEGALSRCHRALEGGPRAIGSSHPSSASNRNHSAKSRWISRASFDWQVSASCECSVAFARYSARLDTTHPLCSGSGTVSRSLRRATSYWLSTPQQTAEVPFQTATQYKDGRLAAVSLSRFRGMVQWLAERTFALWFNLPRLPVSPAHRPVPTLLA
jgi:hypothetical protein